MSRNVRNGRTNQNRHGNPDATVCDGSTQEGNVTEVTDETKQRPNEVETTEELDEVETEAEAVDELEQLRAERDDYLDQLQRSRAEFINFKRRNDQERFLLRELVTRDVLSQFLPVVDDFERALGSLPDSERGNSWVAGMEMIHAKLNGLLERAGVKKVDALGKPFDPKEHEAVATEPGTSGSVVTEVYQAGYKVGDTLLRPAMVKTGDPISESEDKPETFDA
jgi:molecular chaperone GrpE